MQNYTLEFKGKKEVLASELSISTKAFTVMLSIRADGTKDPELIIFSEKRGVPKSIFPKLVLPPNIKITSLSNGYITK